MIDFKEIIAKNIEKVLNKETNIENEKKIDELKCFIEKPNNKENGDFAFPCFKLAKDLKKSPNLIAEKIKENIEIEKDIIEKVEVAGGYLNFFVNKNRLVKEVLEEIKDKKEEYGSSEEGKGKNIIVEYSSPNIAKEFHIGHLRTTVIGAALYNIYKYLGYNTIGINHLGDYGTQFGKMIEGYKRWGSEYNIDENPIEELTK